MRQPIELLGQCIRGGSSHGLYLPAILSGRSRYVTPIFGTPRRKMFNKHHLERYVHKQILLIQILIDLRSLHVISLIKKSVILRSE